VPSPLLRLNALDLPSSRSELGTEDGVCINVIGKLPSCPVRSKSGQAQPSCSGAASERLGLAGFAAANSQAVRQPSNREDGPGYESCSGVSETASGALHEAEKGAVDSLAAADFSSSDAVRRLCILQTPNTERTPNQEFGTLPAQSRAWAGPAPLVPMDGPMDSTSSARLSGQGCRFPQA